MNKIINIFTNSENKLILLKKSTPVTVPITYKTLFIINSMIDILKENGGGRGLAAPQIGINKQIIICAYDRKMDNIEIMINPTYKPINNSKIDSWEGCFSVPLTCAKVSRWSKIRTFYYNAQGIKFNKVLSGIESIIFQHEYDHLQGILIIHKSNEIREFQDYNTYKTFINADANILLASDIKC